MFKSIVCYLFDQFDLWRCSRYYRDQYLAVRHHWECSLCDLNRKDEQYRSEINSLRKDNAALAAERQHLKANIRRLCRNSATHRHSLQSLVKNWHNPAYAQQFMEWPDAEDAMKAGCKCYPVAKSGALEWTANDWIRWDRISEQYVDESGDVYEPCPPTNDYLWRIVEE